MKKPKISIILPVYNVKDFLRQALDSAINQTLKDIEIICVDDCSTDGSLEILKEYEKKDSRIKVIEQKNNMGEVVAKYTGAQIAKADYIGTIDPDDWIEPDTYRCMLEKAQKVNADVAVCNICYVDEAGNLVRISKIISPNMAENDKYLDESNIIKINPGTPNKIIKKDLYIKALNFTERDVWKDMLQYWRCYTIRKCRAVFLTEPFYMYRNRKNSVTHTPITKEVSFETFCKTIDLRLKYLLEHNVYEKYKRAFWQQILNLKPNFEQAYNINKIIEIARKYKINIKDYYIIMDFKQYLELYNIQEAIDKIVKKYKYRKIVLYGAGQFAETLFQNYDLSKLNIVAVCDKKFEDETKCDFYNYHCIVPEELGNYSCNLILISNYEYIKFENIVEGILCGTRNASVEICSLVENS